MTLKHDLLKLIVPGTRCVQSIPCHLGLKCYVQIPMYTELAKIKGRKYVCYKKVGNEPDLKYEYEENESVTGCEHMPIVCNRNGKKCVERSFSAVNDNEILRKVGPCLYFTLSDHVDTMCAFQFSIMMMLLAIL